MADLIEREPLLEKMFPSQQKRLVEEAPAVNRWIPCSEKMPEPLQNVIVCTDIKTVTLAWLMDDNWYFADTGNGHIEQWGLSDVTHWMALPGPYESEKYKKDVNKPEKLTAHWIATVVRDHDGIICSNCRLENTVINEVPFCPWCGAEMSELGGIDDTN